MNARRSGPCTSFVLASALQVFIFERCGVPGWVPPAAATVVDAAAASEAAVAAARQRFQ